MVDVVEKLLAEFDNLLKIKHSMRKSGKPKETIDEFNLRITEKVMKFWPRNVLQMINNEIEKAFLQSKMSDRKASKCSKDKASCIQSNRKKAGRRIPRIQAKKETWR